MTGRILTRDAALDRLSQPEMDEHFLKQEFEYVAEQAGSVGCRVAEDFRRAQQDVSGLQNKRWAISLGAKHHE